jgi:hypothetical protein
MVKKIRRHILLFIHFPAAAKSNLTQAGTNDRDQSLSVIVDPFNADAGRFYTETTFPGSASTHSTPARTFGRIRDHGTTLYLSIRFSWT